MVKLSSAILLVLSVAAVHAGRLGLVGKHKGVAPLATLGLGYGLGHAFDHGLYGHHPTGLYYAPAYAVGHGHPHGHYHGHPNHYHHGAPKHGFHLGYEIGYQGKLGFVKLKRDNLRQVQFSFGLGKPSLHHKA